MVTPSKGPTTGPAFSLSGQPVANAAQFVICKDTPVGTSGNFHFEIQEQFPDSYHDVAQYILSGSCYLVKTVNTIDVPLQVPAVMTAYENNLELSTPGFTLDGVTRITTLGGAEELPAGVGAMDNRAGCTVDLTNGCVLIFHNVPNTPPPPPPPTSGCPDLAPAFGLGPAGAFTVLGLNGANVIISEGATLIRGNVGLGPNDTGALLKAAITGTLTLNGPANPATPDIHSDLIVTGGTVTADLSTAVAAASAASTALQGLAPQQTFGAVTAATTFTGTGGTTHVIKISSVKIIKTTLTFVGGPNDVFIMNVAGDFTFASAQMILKTTAAGTVKPQNIIWNIYSAGADVNVYKAITIWYGVLLVPRRNVIIDHTVGTGGVIGGLKVAIHSAATVVCK
jgi:hypothetical protein